MTLSKNNSSSEISKSKIVQSSIVERYVSQSSIYTTPALQGVILRVSDGIGRVHGLKDIKSGEMVLVGWAQIKAMAINLEHSTVGIVTFGNGNVQQGDSVIKTGKIRSIPLLYKKIFIMFLFLLTIGFIHEWGRGALNWTNNLKK